MLSRALFFSNITAHYKLFPKDTHKLHISVTEQTTTGEMFQSLMNTSCTALSPNKHFRKKLCPSRQPTSLQKKTIADERKTFQIKVI